MRIDRDERNMEDHAPTVESPEAGDMTGISRRKFLGKGAVAIGAAGATVAAAGGLGLLSNGFAVAGTTCATVPGTIKHPAGTYGYTELDPQSCGQYAYYNWRNLLCSVAIVDAILKPLREQLGSPYTNIDPAMFSFGMAGIAGWGTVCGIELGSCIATSIVVGGSTGTAMAKDILAYYSATSLPDFVPTTIHPNCPSGYVPPQTVADSPLCHISVNKWMTATGYTFGSEQRKERCSRLAGSVVKTAVQMLNAWKAGTYTAGAWGGPAPGIAAPHQNNCTECHTT